MTPAAGYIDAFVFMPRSMLDKGAYVDYVTARLQAAQDDLAKELLFCLLDDLESGRFDVRRE